MTNIRSIDEKFFNSPENKFPEISQCRISIILFHKNSFFDSLNQEKRWVIYRDRLSVSIITTGCMWELDTCTGMWIPLVVVSTELVTSGCCKIKTTSNVFIISQSTLSHIHSLGVSTRNDSQTFVQNVEWHHAASQNKIYM